MYLQENYGPLLENWDWKNFLEVIIISFIIVICAIIIITIIIVLVSIIVFSIAVFVVTPVIRIYVQN